MSFVRTLADGAAQAAQLVPLLFALNGVTPAAAQLPRAVALAPGAAVPAVIEPLPSGAPLTLVANHVEVRVAGARAEVLTQLTYRNDGTVPIEARYSVPLPALVLQPGETASWPTDAAPFDCGGDEPPESAQFAEAGEADPRAYASGTLWIEPGEEVTVQMRRTADLLVRNGRHRLVLPLVVDRGATFTPRFSAEVRIEADLPIAALASATHRGQVVGLGERRAALIVPDGRVYEGQFLAVEFELGEAPLATETLAWGGEARPRMAR
jgi:Ca-activated chloride channel family protein